MKHAAALALLFATSVSGEPIYLTNEQGERTGPVELKQNTTLVLDGRKYKVEKLAAPTERLETRVLTVPLVGLLTPVEVPGNPSLSAEELKAMREKNLMQKLTEQCKVDWPAGSSVTCAQNKSGNMVDLLIVNTGNNISSIEKCLAKHPSNEAEITVFFVSFAKTDIEALCKNSVPDAKNLRLLWTSGKAELIAAPMVRTVMGSEASLRGVTECIYPTEFVTAGPGVSNATTQSSIPVPACFERREVGAILGVTPMLNDGDHTFSLTLAPQLVSEPEWKSYKSKYVDLKGVEREASFEQPFFGLDTVVTSVTLQNNELILLGGGAPSKDKSRMIYIFATARLITSGPEPLTLESSARSGAK